MRGGPRQRGSSEVSQRAPHARGYLFLMTTVFMWATGPLFVKHFSASYDVFTQNAFRYACAAAVLLVVAGLRGGLRYPLSSAQRRKLLFVATANILMQTNFAAIYYFLYPAVGGLVGRVNIIFTAVLSFAIFHDERRVIRSPRFLAGSALALIGVVFVITGRDPEILSHLNVSEGEFWIGVALSISSAFLAAVYMLAIKHAVRDIPPLVSFTHVAWMTATGLTLLMLAAGDVSDLWRQPPSGLALMALSAMIAIVIAHTCYYAALRHIKLVVCVSFHQLTPILVCVLSAILYGDRLTLVQMAGGGVVISGAFLAARAQAEASQAGRA